MGAAQVSREVTEHARRVASVDETLDCQAADGVG